MENADPIHLNGLSDGQVLASKEKFGRNEVRKKSRSDLLEAALALIKEPMLVLLMAAASIYFLTGSNQEGLMMLGAIVLISIISLYQETKSRSAIKQLSAFIQPKSTVIRNGSEIPVLTEDIVVGDLLVLQEGERIAADGKIVIAHDFSVNESILTGESLAVSKYAIQDANQVSQGTLVTTGRAICEVSTVGQQTRLAQIKKTLDSIETEKTPLQIQINHLVRNMALIGGLVFLFVWTINYSRSLDFLDSLMKALTLAMSILPEEIPVAYTTFMALGAFRLMKMGVIVKNNKTIETLGSATVICTDKTGTLTENLMSLAEIYLPSKNEIVSADNLSAYNATNLLSMAMWSSETEPYDPMEIAIHQSYEQIVVKDQRPFYKMIFEYPLSGTPPMMTHVFENSSGERIIAAKGAPEAIMAVCTLKKTEKEDILKAVDNFTSKGYRVLGVGKSTFSGQTFPETQQQLTFDCAGLLAFYDPPKKNIRSVLGSFYKAGINVKIITGDNPATTRNIAAQIGFRGSEHVLSGSELVELDEGSLNKLVLETQIFARMFPEAKLRVINALKTNLQIVAMTGDGVNDGPALKAAHIGIAMGKKGSETAKEASSLILQNDDLSGMVDAIAMGRRIYTNLKKAIRYIISIHIPIILTVFVPLLLGWKFAEIFTPVHVIFFELIMGPTCSIVYENEPADKDILSQPPRPFASSLFTLSEMLVSILQGLIITGGLFCVYWYAVSAGLTEPLIRSMVFITLISANFVLTLVNRSFFHSIFITIKYENDLVIWILALSAIISMLVLIIPSLQTLFGLQLPNIAQLLFSILTGSLSVLWFELYKFWLRKTQELNV